MRPAHEFLVRRIDFFAFSQDLPKDVFDAIQAEQVATRALAVPGTDGAYNIPLERWLADRVSEGWELLSLNPIGDGQSSLIVTFRRPAE